MLLVDRLRGFASGLYFQTKDAVGFKEEDHPREDDGKFGSGGGQGNKKTTTTSASGSEAVQKEKSGKVSTPSSKGMLGTQISKEGKLLTSEGKPLPPHVSKIKIPPAWTDVVYSKDPKASLLVKGKDSKGRVQYVYSDDHKAKKDAGKFSRIQELNKKFEKVEKQNEEILRKEKGEKAEAALVLKIIMKTGIRPGSIDDRQAKVKAYGATTLEGRHVEVSKGGKCMLHFIGKKGVENKISVDDPSIAKILAERKRKAGDSGKIFNCGNIQLLKHSSSLDGGGFKTKDFRTLLGTKTAMEYVKAQEKRPTNDKEYKKAVMAVAKKVAEKLGNTPSVALKSYINPVVFEGWRL
jgi:DNA topoisomerase IB